MRLNAALLLTATLIGAVPAVALAEADASGDITVTGNVGITAAQRRVPAQLSAADRATYRQVFLDIAASRYGAAEAALKNLPDGMLTGTAKAQLMIARGTGRASLDDLNTWLAANADLPQTPKVLQLAQRLGTPTPPTMPTSRAFRTVSFNAPMNTRSAQGFGQPGDATLAGRLKPLLTADRTADAESAWSNLASSASEPVATEWAQRTAWSYYIGGDDAGARRVGALAAKGTGEWAALGGWVVGLAAFRDGDCEAAAAGFDTVAARFASNDLSAAAAYWASRAHLSCGRPAEASARLSRAASYSDSFYGLLARRALGLHATQDWAEPDFITADWNHLSSLPGAKRAAALVEIGQLGLADRELRYLAATTDSGDYAPLLRLAAKLTLPATQYWLAQHPPLGTDTPMSARFPAPEWRPYRGWRVDKNIVFAHALQESNFVTSATSRTGAKGIMQLMPGTAKLVAARMADGTEVQIAAIRDLSDPEFNIECGQTYLEQLRDMSYTAGLLPKVIAAYNAGPGSVQKWNTTLRDNGDPLLFIESIPFKETRHYVEVVMRNYWMYQLRDAQPVASMDALVQGLWPRFPGLAGATGVKATPTYVAPPIPAYLAPQLPLDDIVVASAG